MSHTPSMSASVVSTIVAVAFHLCWSGPTLAQQYTAEAGHRGTPGRTREWNHDPTIVYYANAYADHYHVQRELVHAIITTESGWNPLATSNVLINGKLQHAQGLMQLMPQTGRDHGVTQPYSISDNLGGGVYYLSQLLIEFHGEMRLAVAAYYAGTKYVGRKQLSYSNPDVTHYVRTVRANYIRELIMHRTNQPR